MAQYIRLYNSPRQEPAGSILGFSRSLEAAAHDPELHSWLTARGYTVTPESAEQRAAKRRPGGLAFGSPEYREATGIPLPEGSVSIGHLLIEPPLHPKDLQPLSDMLATLGTAACQGFRTCYFIDNRNDPPAGYDTGELLIARWE